MLAEVRTALTPLTIRAPAVYGREDAGMATTEPVLTVRVPPEQYAQVDALAAAEGRTRSELLRDAITALLDQHGPHDGPSKAA